MSKEKEELYAEIITYIKEGLDWPSPVQLVIDGWIEMIEKIQATHKRHTFVANHKAVILEYSPDAPHKIKISRD